MDNHFNATGNLCSVLMVVFRNSVLLTKNKRKLNKKHCTWTKHIAGIKKTQKKDENELEFISISLLHKLNELSFSWIVFDGSEWGDDINITISTRISFFKKSINKDATRSRPFFYCINVIPCLSYYHWAINVCCCRVSVTVRSLLFQFQDKLS